MDDRAARWARALLDAFAQAGVRDVVISPGSRSTPLVIAAAAHPDLTCHDLLDERTAGFFALGQARATGMPSLLVCTSGTAPAHYYPAVIEAAQAYVPLLVLSANRPFERLSCGANQTVDQTKLFGAFVRHFADLGTVGEGTGRAARRAAAQAVHRACHPVPGPVHLDVHARKPLEPPRDAVLSDAEVERPVTRAHPPVSAPAPEGVQLAAALLREAKRGVLVAGPAPLSQAGCREAVEALARRAGLVLCAEAASQLRLVPAGTVPRCDGFDWLWHTEVGRGRWAPDVILQLGAAPTSAGYEQLVEHADARRVVVAPYGWPDPSSGADVLLQASVGPTAEALWEALGSDRVNRGWPELAAADATVWRCVDTVLGDRGGEAWGEAHVTVEVVEACRRAGAVLAVGNSLPIRHLDAWVRGDGAFVPVAAQRGASGIDGLVSGAAGLARAQTRPVALLVGDVSFLHDVGGLAAARHARAPLVVVVLHNGGGRIFEQLPLGAREDLRGAMPHFVTPHGAHLVHAAHLYGHQHVRVENVDALRGALRQALEGTGCTVVEAMVPPHGAMTERERVRAALASALEDRP